MNKGRQSHSKRKNLKIEDIIIEEDSAKRIRKKLQRTKKPKKKIGLFYKANFSILLIISIILSYFVILVATKPKSLPYVTKKIEAEIKKTLGDNANIGKTYLSFTRYGTLKLSIQNFKFSHFAKNNGKKEELIIPKLESEFSLFNLLSMSLSPRKIRLIDAIITTDITNKAQNELVALQDSANGDSKNFSTFFSLITDGKFAIKNLEILNAKLLFKGEKFDREILIKSSRMVVSSRIGSLYISSENILNLDNDRGDVNLNLNCQISKKSNLQCDALLDNFVANSIAELHPLLKSLDQINAVVDASTSFAIKNGEIADLTFAAEARKGDFNFPNFFSEKIEFTNFSLRGKFDYKSGILDLSQIAADIQNNSQSSENKQSPTILNMSLVISGLNNSQGKNFNFDIKLKNAPNAEMEKFWPKSLSQKGIRNWVISHIKNGTINDAYARFLLTIDGESSHLNNIDAEVNFSDFDLKYDDGFPEIKKISGTANFSKNSMKISLKNGDVLNSKIFEGLVEIDDFYAENIALKIYGKSQGMALDGLKHVDYKSEFASKVEKYFNGDSQNDFDIRIPLGQNLSLKNTYMSINSVISNLNNDYVKGGVVVSLKKNSGKDDFLLKADLTADELALKEFDIEKSAGVEAALDLTLLVFDDAKKIHLKDIILKKSLSENSTKQTKNQTAKKNDWAKISGDFQFEISPFVPLYLKITNKNFGRSDYVFLYQADKKNSSQRISITGRALNIAPILERKLLAKPEKGDFANLRIDAKVSRVFLLHEKSLRNFSLSLNCQNGFCFKGALKSSYGKNNFISLVAAKKTKESGLITKKVEKFYAIDGQISEIGYLAEAFGVSRVVSGGNAKVTLINKFINKKQVLDGEITINDSITIYDNAAVKRLAKNDLFSAIKNKIFSNNKTTFDSLRLQFELKSSGLLNIKSLIANNYKIGITAKGFFNLKNDTCQIKGMIVPGFIINNLFGIGKVPLIGGVISGLFTGGEGGGIFGIRYEYVKNKGDKEAKFETNKVSSFVPTTIKSLFDLI